MSATMIIPWSSEAIGLIAGRMTAGPTASQVVTSGTMSWYVPFTISTPFVVRQLFWMNGAAVAGNVDCGVAGADGSLIVSTGSTAQAGTNAPQKPTTTETLLDPGSYYLGLAVSDATARFVASVSAAALWQACGAAQEAAGPALSSKWTPAQITQAYMPVFGISTKTTF